MSNTAYLVLENGEIFEGKSFGAQNDVVAEVVFTTGMTGYLETLTDKSYYGQIVVQTFPLIGNYGVIMADFEAPKVTLSAYIVKDWCREPSNFRSEGNLDTFFKAQNIIGLYDIDTRALVRMIRENGVMNGMITSDLSRVDKEAIANYKIKGAVNGVSVREPRLYETKAAQRNVVLIDYGFKENIKRELTKRGCNVWVVPHNTSFDEILKLKPDGIMLSNGPGDPADNPLAIKTLKQLIPYQIPTFGICLGHQLLALANGCLTAKLKYGHRGANQPVKNQDTGRVYITSQNHGYAVLSQTINKTLAKEIYTNVNDKTCEGITYLNTPAFSVQFHPEACGGPQDTSFLFDEFVKLMEVK